MKKWFLLLFMVLIVIGWIGINQLLQITETREKILEWIFDLTHDNEPVVEQKTIENILASYPVLPYAQLDSTYLHWSKSTQPKYKKLLVQHEYRIIRRADFFQKIVGNFRIRDFVCRDTIYEACLFNNEQNYYWLIDEKLLFAVLNLQRSLGEKKYNPDGFRITYGHRHPKQNEEVNGASLSRHIRGQAIDMVIQDIDGDGKYTKRDKDIVLEIADKEVIGNHGGVGKYPGTSTVHIDVRGKRARWDAY